MNYAEAAYFDGYHFQHIAAYHEDLRLKAIDKRNRQCFKSSLSYRRNRANEESEGEAKAGNAANREDVRSLQARLYQQV